MFLGHSGHVLRLELTRSKVRVIMFLGHSGHVLRLELSCY
jgi:predicted nucleic acid-binding Zn finger protein